MTKRNLLFFLSFISLTAMAQNAGAQMADAFRQDGKIRVVIAVLVLIFIAIIAFLFFLERKLSKLEKQIKETSSIKKQVP